MQDKPATVPPRAKQAGETAAAGDIRTRWAWVEASVWTDRMLAALRTKVKEASGTNAFFAKHGLFSLEQAHVLACQSMKMAH